MQPRAGGVEGVLLDLVQRVDVFVILGRRRGREPQHGQEGDGCCCEQQAELPGHWARKKTTKPMRARASPKAMPRNMVVRTLPAAAGRRAMAWSDWPTRQPMPERKRGG